MALSDYDASWPRGTRRRRPGEQGDVGAEGVAAGRVALANVTAPQDASKRAAGLACLAVAAALVLLGPAALAEPAPQAGPGQAGAGGSPVGGLPTGPVGLLGFAAYHTLGVDAVNADIQSWNAANPKLPQLPLLPSTGYAPGFGVLVGIAPRLTFATAGSELNVERRTADAFSRLRINDTQVGLYYLARSGPRWRLLVGGLVGLASVEFEWSVRQPANCTPDGLVNSCLSGNRWSRLMLSLQPEVGVQVALTDSAGLFIAAGYLVATDFWNPEWAHGMGVTLRGRPDAFSGLLLKVSLIVGTM